MFTIELFSGYIRFNIFLFLVDFILIIFFFYSWYNSYKKIKWGLDFWHFIVLKSFFIPLLVMYPFNASHMNIAAVGGNYQNIKNYVDFAFIISIIGYISFNVGAYVYNKSKTGYVNFLHPLQKFLVGNLSSRFIIILTSLLSIILILWLIYIQIISGSLFNPRLYFQYQPHLRPIYRITILLYSTSAIYLIIRQFHIKSFLERLILSIYILFIPFIGTRGAVLEIISIAIIFYIFIKGKKVRLTLVFITLSISFFLLITIEGFRHGDFSFNIFTNIFTKIFYGNNFAETRDFAWILCYWDFDYLFGKTYLAGFISFIPQSFSSFRSDWGFSNFTNGIVGFDDSHNGLRPGVFGEAFFNFGFIGVITLGFILGYTLRYIDIMIKKEIIIRKNYFKAYSYTILWTFISSLALSIGFSDFYALTILIIIFAILRQFYIFWKN